MWFDEFGEMNFWGNKSYRRRNCKVTEAPKFYNRKSKIYSTSFIYELYLDGRFRLI